MNENYKQKKYKYKFIKSIVDNEYTELYKYITKYLDHSNNDNIIKKEINNINTIIQLGGSNNLDSKLKDIIIKLYDKDISKDIYLNSTNNMSLEEFNNKIIHSIRKNSNIYENILGGLKENLNMTGGVLTANIDLIIKLIFLLFISVNCVANITSSNNNTMDKTINDIKNGIKNINYLLDIENELALTIIQPNNYDIVSNVNEYSNIINNKVYGLNSEKKTQFEQSCYKIVQTVMIDFRNVMIVNKSQYDMLSAYNPLSKIINYIIDDIYKLKNMIQDKQKYTDNDIIKIIKNEDTNIKELYEIKKILTNAQGQRELTQEELTQALVLYKPQQSQSQSQSPLNAQLLLDEFKNTSSSINVFINEFTKLVPFVSDSTETVHELQEVQKVLQQLVDLPLPLTLQQIELVLEQYIIFSKIIKNLLDIKPSSTTQQLVIYNNNLIESLDKVKQSLQPFLKSPTEYNETLSSQQSWISDTIKVVITLIGLLIQNYMIKKEKEKEKEISSEILDEENLSVGSMQSVNGKKVSFDKSVRASSVASPGVRASSVASPGVRASSVASLGMVASPGVRASSVASPGMGSSLGMGMGSSLGMGMGSSLGMGMGSSVGMGMGSSVGSTYQSTYSQYGIPLLFSVPSLGNNNRKSEFDVVIIDDSTSDSDKKKRKKGLNNIIKKLIEDNRINVL